MNPLAPHYRCECGFTEFVKDGSVFCGADLSRANCRTVTENYKGTDLIYLSKHFGI